MSLHLVEQNLCYILLANKHVACRFEGCRRKQYILVQMRKLLLLVHYRLSEALQRLLVEIFTPETF